MLQVINGLKS